ncbi:hypothetical protein [Halolamina salifodinae]|uniref:Uncharacterized protein n=1 Tax=Halolamina salifodinae TaxID=1202767 RepID=A0A8T4GWP5_9EURY|nr:hypothetical protein [Halolamina salifodinae]MBP1987346.1 hypothetical protein [Halolamina salifodinae]
MLSTNTDAGTLSRGLAGGAVLAALLASAVLLFPQPPADVFFTGIVLLCPLFAVVGAAGAWTGHTALVWVAALLSVGLTLAGAMSVGLLFAPAALLLLGSAVAAQAAGPDTAAQESLLADPPEARERAQKALLGVAGIVVGAAAVDAAALDRDLFGSCAQETLGCVLQTTNWGLVGLTLLGFGAVAGGG